MRLDYRHMVVGIVLACCVLATGYSETMLTYISRVPAVYSLSFLLILLLIALPSRKSLFSVPLALAAFVGFNYVNHLKIAAVELPVTFLDIRMAVSDPATVVNATGTRRFLVQVVVAIGVVGVALAVGAFGRRRRYRTGVGESRAQGAAVHSGRGLRYFARIASVLLVFVLARECLVAYGRFVQDNLPQLYPKLWEELWTAEAQVALFRRLGPMEYVAFTYVAGDGEAQASEGQSLDPPAEELRSANRKLFHEPPRARAMLPNIVFFHAESTFDPNVIFKLSNRIDLPLWSRTASTVAVGPLRVNVIGGGSWVTEFEVLTGVDRRIFGYQGYYTHSYIAPMTRNSFVRYLIGKGYTTAAYYSADGRFYNTENAFRAYGFQEFLGPTALGLSSDWALLTDHEIARRSIESGAFARPGPFFSFISTTQNHGPHPCRHFAPGTSFKATFAWPASFQQECGLNEYLRRAEGTSQALELVIDQLKDVERRTGRPFVLLAYGDHQPWSFTDGLYTVTGGIATNRGIVDFSGLRAVPDKDLTFFHVLASDQGVLKGVGNESAQVPPATLLPSLISAFVASSEQDRYLPVNVLAFAKCGTDFKIECDLYPDLVRWWKQYLLTPRP
jgi:hypothetical protein